MVREGMQRVVLQGFLSNQDNSSYNHVLKLVFVVYCVAARQGGQLVAHAVM